MPYFILNFIGVITPFYHVTTKHYVASGHEYEDLTYLTGTVFPQRNKTTLKYQGLISMHYLSLCLFIYIVWCDTKHSPYYTLTLSLTYHDFQDRERGGGIGETGMY